MPSAVLFNGQAQVLHGPKDLRLTDKFVSPPLPNEVQIAIRSTTLCGSDVHYYMSYSNGGIQIKEPLSQGHESAGEVVAVGENVSALQIGDRVALEVGVPCDACEDCATGRYNVCTGMNFRSSAASFPHFQGTLQTRLNHPAKWCHKLPDSMSYDQGALLEPLGVAVHAVRKAGLAPGVSCLVIGAGAVGLLCAAAARAAGYASITMADVAENRLQFALSQGFASAVSPMTPRKAETLEDKLSFAREYADEFCKAGQQTGEKQSHKFAATFECTGVESCVQAAIYASLPATRASGKVVLVGMGSPIQTLPIAAATHREVDLIGVWRYANTYPESIDIMRKAGHVGTDIPDLSSIITHRFEGLERVPEAFELAAKSSDPDGKLVVKVVVHNS